VLFLFYEEKGIEMPENSIFVVRAVDLTHDGLGVTKLEDGYTVFVEDLLKGEAAKIEVIERRKSYGFGKVIERLNRSPYRQAPKCKHFYECGGCELMHMDYDVQTAFKKYRIELMVKKLNQDDIIVEEITSMVNPYHYRNKVEIKFAQGEKGIKAGFFKAKSHHVVDLQECFVMQKKSFELLNLIRNLANQFHIKAYDASTNQGVLKSAVIRESNKYKEISVLFNVATDEIPNEKEFVEAIANNIPEVKGIGISKTLVDESFLSDEKIRLVYGRDYVRDEILDKQFEIGFRSFFQVNTLQAERLYKKVIEFARFTNKDRVIDAYSGIGSIALSIADKVNKVFGIEIVKSAIDDSKRNARINGITNALFELGHVDKVLEKWKNFNFDAIIVDPPRKGCSKELLDSIIKMKFPKVIYISCNPATLARDLEFLLKNNYKINRIAPVDMFPQTSHVESVSLLSLK
jgi:23S rRNA (uracil1939-C5)-methyltransferase